MQPNPFLQDNSSVACTRFAWAAKINYQMQGLRDSVEAGMKSTQKALSEANNIYDRFGFDQDWYKYHWRKGRIFKATAFAKSISQIGIQLGNVGDEIENMDQLSTESISGLASFLDQQILRYSSLKMGSIKTKGDMITRFIFKCIYGMWKTTNLSFLMKIKNVIQNFEIQERTQNSFVVQNDLLKLHFQKVQ